MNTSEDKHPLEEARRAEDEVKRRAEELLLQSSLYGGDLALAHYDAVREHRERRSRS